MSLARVTDAIAGDELTRFQVDCLAALRAIGPCKGLAIKALLIDRYDVDVNHGRLYPNLDQLVELGLVEKGQRDKRTNEYTLTDQGKEVLDARIDWLAGVDR